ncbi:iron ABC transporter ATP-binding protein [Chachezhania sediminis]|uniref:iron ABC transporter ATP-binding protein n=1 Tax=Chachezhania sediminis TaxID=2599291 RepID=UPI00131C1A64|nr:ATP-binding cassette domain-containing protein [Chachezhania sediminis]
MIRIEDLSHSIAGMHILRDITLTLPRGGVTALIGPNGAGKSTLLSLIARLERVQSGRIEIDGCDLSGIRGDELARKRAILTQHFDIAPRLSVQQLVAFGRYPHSRGQPTVDCHTMIDRAIARFDLQDLRHRMIDTLSGGQRQRALIAMIYVQDSPYMLLDEPLNNLDIAASRSLMQHLVELAEQDGRTVLVVLHDVNYAAAYADRIVALAGGRVVLQGAPADVVDATLLREVFGTDATVEQVGGRAVVMV